MASALPREPMEVATVARALETSANTASAQGNLDYRHGKLGSQALELGALLPAARFGSTRRDNHRVGTEVSKLILQGRRHARIAHLAPRGESLSPCPCQRARESLMRVVQLVVDVATREMRARTQDGREDVELDLCIGEAASCVACIPLPGNSRTLLAGALPGLEPHVACAPSRPSAMTASSASGAP